jgi:hypothetical protein
MALGSQSRAGRRLGLAALTTLVVLLAAPAARASFHDVDVREVFPGTTASPTADYIVLQSWAPGQNQLHFGTLTVYTAGGTGTNYSPTGDVTNGANNATALIANSGYSAVFATPVADFTTSVASLDPAGGAVCWNSLSIPPDCVSWGAYTGGALPDPQSAHFQGSGTSGAILDGKAIRRKITPGCSTLLENSDDTDNGVNDFEEVDPAPRANASAITEVACSTGGGPVTTPPATTQPSLAPAKKCKKGRKLKRGKCVKKKRKKK